MPVVINDLEMIEVPPEAPAAPVEPPRSAGPTALDVADVLARLESRRSRVRAD